MKFEIAESLDEPLSTRLTLPAEPRCDEDPPPVKVLRIVNVSGDEPSAGTRMQSYCMVGADDCIYEIAPGIVTRLGRGLDNQIVLLDRAVSRQHVSLQPTAAGLRMLDCDSANGVRVNGSAVRVHVLSHGDCLQVGKFVFFVVQGNRAEAVKWRKARRPSRDAEETLDDQTLRRRRTDDVQGILSALDLLTLIQVLVEQRQSGELALSQRAQLLGSICFVDGRIIHAETPNGLSGGEAFYVLLRTHRAQFAFRRDLATVRRTIELAPTELLLEGCRRLDEAKREEVRAASSI